MVKHFLFLLAAAISGSVVFAQKVDSIYFHLYTDSLKKGFYNYINVDGKRSDGTWLPLTNTDITLFASTGTFRGNDLFIDSTFTGETVTVKAVLKSNPAVWKEATIYIRKRPFGPLPSEEELFDKWQHKSKKTKQQFI